MASIQKRVNKAGEVSYQVSVFLGFDEAGNKLRQFETVHGTKKEAKAVAAKLEEARAQGRIVPGRKKTMVGSLLDDLLRDYKLNGKDQEHLEEGRITKSLRPWFGAIDANKLTTKQVNGYIDKRKIDGVTNSTINRELSLVRHALKMGMLADQVARAPKIPKLKEGKARSGFLEYDEYRAMRDALPAHLKPVLTIAFYTGMRKGEILKLLWDQVDLLERVITLNPGETKNKEGRLLPLDGELLETIRMQRAIRDEKHPDCPWVFHWRGKRIRDFRGSWEIACKKAGLWDAARVRGKSGKRVGGPNKLVHDLRRTGVRNLVRAGVPEKVAMAISGHKTRDVFERYNILDMRDLRSAMRSVSAFHEANAKASEERIPARFQHEASGDLPQ